MSRGSALERVALAAQRRAERRALRSLLGGATDEVAASVVRVGPHTRMVDGRPVRVDGYTYHRKDGLGSDREFPAQPSKALAPMTKDQAIERAGFVEAAVKRAKRNGQDTESLYKVRSKDKDRYGKTVYRWSRQRSRAHAEIIRHFMEKSKNVPRDRKAIFSGGLGGSGKGTTLKGPAGIDQSQYLTIDPDGIKEEMAKRGMVPYVEGLTPMEAAALIHEESGDLAKQLAKVATQQGMNVIWDITMSQEFSVSKRLRPLKDAGYETKAIFVSIPIEVSVQRAIGRWRRGIDDWRARKQGSMGGRYVPPGVIQAQATLAKERSQNELVFKRVRKQFDSWEMYDNSEEGKGPKKIDSSA